MLFLVQPHLWCWAAFQMRVLATACDAMQRTADRAGTKTTAKYYLEYSPLEQTTPTPLCVGTAYVAKAHPVLYMVDTAATLARPPARVCFPRLVVLTSLTRL